MKMVILLYAFTVLSLFRDLLIHIFPTSVIRFLIKPSDFAFIAHPRDIKEISNKYFLFNLLPLSIATFISRYILWTVIASRITGLKDINGNPIDGLFIGIPILPTDMINNKKWAKKRIIRAVKFAKKTGVSIVGLGGITASLTRGGLDIVENVDIAVTTGHATTTYTVIENVLKIIKFIEVDISILKIAIVGAGGSIGSSCAKILALKGIKNLILVDIERKQDLVDKVTNEITALTENNLEILKSFSVDDIQKADIIIGATNSPEAIIKSNHLKSGTIVINDAQPSDIDPEVIWERNDVVVIEGGILHAPDINPHINIALYKKSDIFSCLAEVMVLCQKGHFKHYTLGRFKIELVNEIAKDIKKAGFYLAEWQNSQGGIDDDRLNKVKNIIKNNGYS